MQYNFKLFISVFLSTFILTCLIIYQTEQYDPKHSLLLKYYKEYNNQPSLNVFIDLGANKGDSLLNFLNLRRQAQGGNIYSSIKGLSTENQQWIIYLFEANDRFTQKLSLLKHDVEKIGHIVHLHNQTAAWIYDGTIDFYLDTFNEKHDFWGSSLKRNHPDVKKSNQAKVAVKCVDIARIIGQYSQNDNIIVKMDIEGAEYDLLQDFVKKNIMQLIDHIAVEFHPYVSSYKKINDVFVSLIKLYNVNFIEWA